MRDRVSDRTRTRTRKPRSTRLSRLSAERLERDDANERYWGGTFSLEAEILE